MANHRCSTAAARAHDAAPRCLRMAVRSRWRTRRTKCPSSSTKLGGQPSFRPLFRVCHRVITRIEAGQIAAGVDFSFSSIQKGRGDPHMCDELSISPAWCRIDSESCRIEEHVLLPVWLPRTGLSREQHKNVSDLKTCHHVAGFLTGFSPRHPALARRRTRRYESRESVGIDFAAMVTDGPASEMLPLGRDGSPLLRPIGGTAPKTVGQERSVEHYSRVPARSVAFHQTR